MEKISWKQVRYNDRRASMPSLRWGHSSCIIDDEVFYFAGYADSQYMNDGWTFNTITMQWTQIETLGDRPSPRSNCSMNYDRENNRVIVFGGGGANKRRFNTINILDWKTKEWMQIAPKINEPAPWQRTYHTAELYYPYLIVFGGEGVGDLDDAWVFNFVTMGWTEVPIPKEAARPCARRFHSSALVNNQLYIIAGCYSKYRCLSDIYSMDMSILFETGKADKLRWRERKMKDNTFLTRWGHTSEVYEDKIYVFGGRFCNDLNDILVLDPMKDQINTLKVQGDLPKARRRHSACFLGSSMLIFGGFNGEYFNDLYYINIANGKKKITAASIVTLEKIEQLKRLKTIQWRIVQTINGEDFQICQGLLVNRFNSIEHICNFLLGIHQKYSVSQLEQLMLCLYRGYGKIDSSLIFQYGINICEFKEELDKQVKRSIAQEEREVICSNKRLRPIQPLIILQNEDYNNFLQNKRNEQVYYDISFNIGQQLYLRANKAVLALKSSYFANILSNDYRQKSDIINLPFNEGQPLQTLIHYLGINFLVVCKDFDQDFWLRLTELAEYFSLPQLMLICQNQLLAKINNENCQKLLVAALDLGINELAKGCAEKIIKNMVNQGKQQNIDIFPQMDSSALCYKRQRVLKDVYGLLRFDILQKKISAQQEAARNSRHKIEGNNSQYQQEEKQNFQIN